jgi:hypothetical protein
MTPLGSAILVGAIIFVAGFAMGYFVRAMISYRRRRRYSSVWGPELQKPSEGDRDRE